MRLNLLLPVLLCWLPFAMPAQQPSAPAANSTASHPAQMQPQVGPAPQASAPGQNAPAPGQLAEATPQPGQIRLDVVVKDKRGDPVAGLQRSDFTLLDNNHPATIQSFQAYGGSAPEPAVPTQIFLVVDMVNLGFRETSYVRIEMTKFLRGNGGRLAHPVSIYWFSDTGLEYGEGPSTDGNQLAAKVDATQGQLRDMNRTAGAWGAIERFEMSMQTLDKVVRSAATRPGRKLLIWIGPGWPQFDNPNILISGKQQQKFFANIVGLSTLIRQAQLQIYSVTPGYPTIYTYVYQGFLKGVKKPSQVQLPDMDLKVLAVESGGQVMGPSNDLAGQIEQCARYAGPYYTIFFTPPRADGPNDYHQLKVNVDKPGLTALTNTGYYDQPPGGRDARP